MATTIKLRNSVVKDKTPLPSELVIGEVCVGAHPDSPMLLFKDSADNIIKIEPGSGVTPGPAPGPDSPSAGDLWFDTDTGLLYYYNGSAWVELGTAGDSPVTSVNGKVGAVVLSFGDVGAASAAQGAKADTAIQPGVVNPVYFANQAAFPDAASVDVHGGVAHSHADGAMFFAHNGAWTELANADDYVPNGDWSGYADAVDVEDDDLFILNRAGTTLTVKGSEIGGGAKPIDPDAGDISGPISGTGTEADPFILTSDDVNYNGTVVTIQDITISNQKAGNLVGFEDVNAGTNGARFTQPAAVVGGDGTWTGKLTFTDTPASTSPTTFTGKLKLVETEIYFQWAVEVKPNATIAKPTIIAPPDGAGIGGDVTYTPRTSAVTNVATAPISNDLYIDGSVTLAGSGEYVGGFDDWNALFTNPWGSTTKVNMTNPAGNVIAEYTFKNPVNVSSIQYVASVTAGTADFDLVGPDGSYIANSSFNVNANDRELDVPGGVLKGFRFKQTSGSNDNILVNSIGFNGQKWDAENTVLTLTDDKSYNAADGADMGQPISETFTAGQTVTAESTVVYADEPCFSATPYSGTGATHSIETGIDNSTPIKSLLWVKQRTDTNPNALTDSERPISGSDSYPILRSNETNEEANSTGAVTKLNSNGFKCGSNSWYNKSGDDYVAWNWRAAPGFFDVVTYEGNDSSSQDIPHTLGTKPGFMIVKSTTRTSSWEVYHSTLGAGKTIRLNYPGEAITNSGFWGTGPTDAIFTVGSASNVNENGDSYVAYLFADTENLIKCGSYVAPSPMTPLHVETGFKVGWVMVKCTDYDSPGAHWSIFDTQRGSGSNSLYADDPKAENGLGNSFVIDPADGFKLIGSDDPRIDKQNQTYIYVAIAEDAVAPPTAAAGTVSSVVNNILTLSDVGGTWSAGDFAVNNTEATKTGPGADTLEFVGSIPTDVPADSVGTWGNAIWQVADNSGFTDLMEGTKLIANAEIQQTLSPAERGSIVLAADTQYWARLRYAAADPDVQSPYSSVVTFKTADNTPPVPPVDDVFSTTVYTGNGTSMTQTIVTGIDNTVRSLVWIKSIDNNFWHTLRDTIRGPMGSLASNDTQGATSNNGVSSFTDEGFVVGSENETNYNDRDFVAWNWRAAPGFFDIIEYTGTGSDDGQVVAHDLQSEPAFVIGKRYDGSGFWYCYHKDVGFNNSLKLNTNDPKTGDVTVTAVSDTDITMMGSLENGSDKYMAYLFADTPGLIQCGTYTGTGRAEGIEVATSFAPGWLMIKNISEASDWYIWDTTRQPTNANSKTLSPNVADAQKAVLYRSINFYEDRFQIIAADSQGGDAENINHSGNEYVYVCIAKGTNTTFFDPESFNALNEHQVERRFGIEADKVNTRKLPIAELTNEPRGVTAAFVPEGDKYRPIQNQTGEVNKLNAEVDAAQTRVAEAEQRMADFEAAWLTRIEALEDQVTGPGTADS